MVMHFEVIIGNPPYNNDIYLDFGVIAHNNSSKYTCMITPAKWVSKVDPKIKDSMSIAMDKNETFRTKVMPYMSKIVYFRNVKDVFDVSEPSGITYYVTDKEIHSEKLVMNVCSLNKNFDTHGKYEIHPMSGFSLYSNRIMSIVDKVSRLREPSMADSIGCNRQVFVSEQDAGVSIDIYRDNIVGVFSGTKLLGYKPMKDLITLNNLEKYKCIQPCMVFQGSGSTFRKEDGLTYACNAVTILGPNQVPKGSFQVMGYFDTYDEAKNFKVYLQSKLASFLLLVGICGVQVTQTFYRYVPDPLMWNRPRYEYTDAFLYSKYNLSDEDIHIIETTVVAREN